MSTNEEYIKDFDSWNTQAKILDNTFSNEFFHEREIWWCALGVNIGSEQDGKNDSFERPVLIIRKIYSDLLLIALLTSKIKNEPDRISTSSSGQEGQILLSHLRTISNKRLLRKVCRIREQTFYKVIIGLVIPLLESLKIETPQ